VRNEDLKEVMNSGWTRNQGVVRCDPETNDPRLYPTFAPKAIGMKGKKLPDTTLSRAIIIEMKRKQPGEVVHDFDHLDNEDFKTLRRKLVRWATDDAEVLRTATPQAPPGFHNRTRMNWQLLLAIAELAGKETADSAREAAQAIEHDKDEKTAPLNVQLLADLRRLFDRKETEAMLSREIIEELVQDDEAPWGTFGRNDKPLTQRQLANLLRPFGIVSGTVYAEPGSSTHGKGYRRWQFEEAWGRYLKPEDGADEYDGASATDTDSDGSPGADDDGSRAADDDGDRVGDAAGAASPADEAHGGLKARNMRETVRNSVDALQLLLRY
jgi:hypothetical protein